MENLLNDIIDYTLLLKHNYNLQASFDFSMIPAKHSELLLPFILHDNSYCFQIKKCYFKKCMACRHAVLRKQTKIPYYGKCYAGVEEYVFPVTVNGKTVNFISISGYRSERYGKPNFEKIGRDHELDITTLEKNYYELDTNIPELDKIKTVVQPLVYMVTLYMIYLKNFNEQSLEDKTNVAYTTAIGYIAENYKNNPTISEIASYLNFSESYLSHLFKKYGNTSITQYLIKVKMINAADLLIHTNKNITKIADELGYNDPNYFTLQFKNFYGVSPRTYRRQNTPPPAKFNLIT